MWISHIEIYSKKFRVGYRTNFPVIQLHVSSCFHGWYKWLQLSNLAYAQQGCAQVHLPWVKNLLMTYYFAEFWSGYTQAQQSLCETKSLSKLFSTEHCVLLVLPLLLQIVFNWVLCKYIVNTAEWKLPQLMLCEVQCVCYYWILLGECCWKYSLVICLLDKR